MANLNSLQMGNFYDEVNFPFGFHRSGDFTRKQAELLTASGKRMLALYRGNLQPESAADQSFVDVFSGLKAASSEEEKVWLRYLKAIDRRNEYITHLTRAPGLEIRETLATKEPEVKDSLALEQG